MPKLKIEDFDKSMEAIIQRPRKQAESHDLLDKLRQAAQKRKGSVGKLPQLKGR